MRRKVGQPDHDGRQQGGNVCGEGGSGEGASTSCISTADISAGQGVSSGYNPSLVVDEVNGKLLVVAGDANNANRPALYRCALDGTSCTHTDISAGQGTTGDFYPNRDSDAVIDTVNQKLLVATTNAANGGRPALFRCELDGSGCTYTDISAGQGLESGDYPSVLIDTENRKLLVLTTNSLSDGP
ncbi:MAG TPA: hypothetical protein VGJ84_15270 [Polyangiaceae bacterium]